MSRQLTDLDPVLLEKVMLLIAGCAERGIGVVVIDTLRTEEEHAANLANGTSWTARSKHLPDANGRSRAVDLAPERVLGMKGWAPQHRFWETMGELGESLGLRWGGRWAARDWGHFELPD